MRLLWLLLVIAMFQPAHAQDTKNQPRNKKPFIGFNFSPDYCNRTLKNNDGGSSADMVINVRNDTEMGKFGFTTGLNICFPFSDLVAFETGIQYSNKGHRTKSLIYTTQQPDPSAPKTARYKRQFHYIEIPLKINLTAGKGNFQFISSTGINVNILESENSRVTYEYEDGHTKKNKIRGDIDYKNLNLSPFFSAGMQCKLRGNTFLRVEPTFRYGVIKTTNTPVVEYLWNAGLNIGCYYRFK